MDITHRDEELKSSKSKGSRYIIIAISIAVVIFLASLQYSKGLLVAATVNGSPISRWAVIGNLEKQAGKQALDSLITEKLIESKLGEISVSKEEIDGEIKKIEQQVTSQGATMDAALKQQGMTMEQLQDQITMRKKLEKLLADKAQISDEEVNTYIKDNKVTPKNGEKPEDFKVQVKLELQQQKYDQVAGQWMSDLKTNAKINYYVKY
ncbi:MAG: hypothetical protein AAB446_02100 [Patescibacteria group bacterium]